MSGPGRASGSVDQVIDRNVQALIDLRKKHDAAKRPGEKRLDAIAAFTGSPRFIYLHLLLLAGYALVNSGWSPLQPFDPFPFRVLTGAASVEAIFLSTLLMINQNRLKTLELRREDLDLQTSLLIEHELTRLGRVCDGIAKRVGAPTPDAAALTEDIPPTKVLERIEAVEKTNEP